MSRHKSFVEGMKKYVNGGLLQQGESEIKIDTEEAYQKYT